MFLKPIRLAFFSLLFLLSGCCPRQFIPETFPQALGPFKVPKNIRIALVLGSGGVRGMAHVGVLEELINAGLKFDVIIGCSAGSVVGALYADSLDIDHVKKAVRKMKSNKLLDINIWEARFGLSQGSTLLETLDGYLEAERFDQLKIPLIIVAADVYSGELVPIGSGNLVKAIRASCSIPFVFVPVEFEGRILVDGGVINPVPVCVARDLGADLVIAVDLCELLPSTFPTNLFEIAARSAEIASLWQTSHCIQNADIVIRPKMCQVGTFNDKLKSQLYQAGREAAREALPKILQELSYIFENEPAPPRLVQLSCYRPIQAAFE